MGRKPHIVQPMGMGQWPAAYVVLQAAVKPKYESDADTTGHTVFDAWSAMFCETLAGMPQESKAKCGHSSASFWSWLTGQCKRFTTVWLFSYEAREIMAAMGLWEKFLMGDIVSNFYDPYCRPDRDQAGDRDKTGFVILEGPPTIATFNLLGCETDFTWVCTGNFGAGNLRCLSSDGTDGKKYLEHVPADHWLQSRLTRPIVDAVYAWLRTYVHTLRTLNLGAIERTAASQASVGYRRRYLSERIAIHDNECVTAMERDSLLGGRCECRFIGGVYAGNCSPQAADAGNDPAEGQSDEGADLQTARSVPATYPRGITSSNGPIFRLDVNSLYPAVAMDAELPIRLETTASGIGQDLLLAACKRRAVIAEVTVDVHEPVCPMRTDDNTIFPVGRFETVLCGPEILLASRHGRIAKVGRVAVYQTAKIYGQWVRDLYDMRVRLRCEDSGTAADCVKALLNASFGKWAQSLKRWVDRPGETAPWPFYQWWQVDPRTRKAEQWRSFAWNVQRLEVVGEPGDSFPAITSYINSLGRVRLWQLIQTAGPADVYYYDTDSLWLNERGYNALAAAGELGHNELGKMKQEDAYDCVWFMGQKRYVADGYGVCAGAASRPCNPGDVFHLQLKVPPLSYYLSKAQLPGLDRKTARVRLNVPYTLGKVGANGWVEPLVAG